MSEVKSELKLARDCIKKKEHKEGLKHCKNVLKVDKENYNALVFIGVCATELEQYDQARQAYRKAILVNDQQALAWQGLCACIEKADNVEWQEDLVEAYQTLLKYHIVEDEKWIEKANKLIVLLRTLEDLQKAADWTKSLIEKLKSKEEKVKLWKNFILICNQIATVSGFSDEIINQITAGYKAIIEFIDEVNVEVTCLGYLDFILLTANFGASLTPTFKETTELAKTFYEKYPSNNLLEIFCQLLIYNNLGNNHLDNETREIYNRLAESENESETKALVSLLLQIEKGGVTKDKMDNLSKQACEKSGALVWFSLARAYHLHHINNDALDMVEKCRQHSLSKIPFKDVLENLCLSLFALETTIVLSMKDNEKHWLRIIEQSKSLQLNTRGIILKAFAYLRTNDKDNCQKLIEEISQLQNTSSEDKKLFLRLEAAVSVTECQLFDAELRLGEALEIESDGQTLLELAQVYWKLGETKQDYLPKAYLNLVKSAKHDPNNATTYVYLGRYQRDFIKDQQKALKCFEKAFSLDVSDEEAGASLSQLYLQLNMEDKAVKVYEVVTSRAPPGGSIWCWVRSGLVYLKQKNADKAIICFQNALRGDPNISHYWECLAEAYYIKGSYTSALRSFTQALKLDEISVYCKYMLGKIKQMLSMCSEAIDSYNELLKNHPDYVPALLGLAESHLQLVRSAVETNFDARAVCHAKQVLDSVASAAKMHPQYSCLWKTAGDALSALHAVRDLSAISLPSNLATALGLSDKAESKSYVLLAAARCHSMAVRLQETCASYWHDAALSTYRYGQFISGDEGSKQVQLAIQMAKKSLSLDSGNHVVWNTFGVMMAAASNENKICGQTIDDGGHNPSASQHAFIKALQLNSQDAVVWANLGTLYLKHDKIMMAHEAFKRAQSCDPALSQAWIGQACIAEVMANEDAMDLFRHSTELKFHSESSTAYSEWALRLVASLNHTSVEINARPQPDLAHLPTRHARKVVVNAAVLLAKYTERNEDEAWAFNSLGLLLEHQALFNQAERAFSKARKCLGANELMEKQPERLRIVLLNQARVLTELGKHEDAVEIYKICTPHSTIELCQLACTLACSGSYEKSQTAYEQALTGCEDSHQRSCILTALGQLAYKNQNIANTKSYLFQSCQEKNCSEAGLMALTSLGLIRGDATLAEAALVEVRKHDKLTERFEVHKAILLSSFYILQGNTATARRIISRAVLRFPRNSKLWSRLTSFILKHQPIQIRLAGKCNEVAQNLPPNQHTILVSGMTSLSFPNIASLLRSAQRLVHSYPHDVKSWALLAADLFGKLVSSAESFSAAKTLKIIELALAKVDALIQEQTDKKITDHVMLRELYYWLIKQFILCHVHYGERQVADAFCDRLISSTDERRRAEFIFLKGIASIQPDGHLATENLRIMATVAKQQNLHWMWEYLSSLYELQGYARAALLSLREVVKQRVKQGQSNFGPLLTMCLLAVCTYDVTQQNMWMDTANQAVDELLKLKDGHELVILMRALIFRLQSNLKAAVKYIQKLEFSEDIDLSAVVKKIELICKK